MTIRNVAIIFDDTVRSDTTGRYCLSALRPLVNVEHFLPSKLQDIPRRAFDLYLSIDDGLDYGLPADLGRTALWAIDTHLSLERIIKRARWASMVFSAQRNGAELLSAKLGRDVPWLPLACDPEVHRRHELPKSLDVAFIGNLNCPNRVNLLNAVRDKFPNTLVAQRYGEEMSRTYSASRVVLNRSIRDDVNMRVFEALACGSLLITNALDENGQSSLFESGTHLATYRSNENLLEQIDFYLAQESLRERVAAAGRAEVLARHTYAHRMTELLEVVEGGSTAAISLPGPSVCASTTDMPESDFDPNVARTSNRDGTVSGNGRDLGCVLALKDRPAHYLERTLQTYAYQSSQPIDRVLVDYGSDRSLGHRYAAICRTYDWRYVRVAPGRNSYSAGAACNIGVARMDSRVGIVFRSDVDILLGQGVLAAAHRRGREGFVVFRGIRSGPCDADYPPAFLSSEQLDLFVRRRPFLESMEGDGVAAFPRDWFVRIGGYDLNFEGWGFEDSDLRARAERSIGVFAQIHPVLVHQWHPRSASRPTAMANHAYFQRMSMEQSLVRNGGRLVRCGWDDRIEEDRSNVSAPAVDQSSHAVCA